MLTISNKLSNKFIQEIKSIYYLKKELLSSNNIINYINVYHKKWKNKKQTDNKLKKYIDEELKCPNIISFGYINAPPNCKKQKFHIDYGGYTNTYFIPLVELNDYNGTEYVNFFNEENNIKFQKKLLNISNKYLYKKDIIRELRLLGLIYKKDYNFKYINAEPFSILLMKNYIFHRGRKNQLNSNRIMFQIVCGIDKNVNITDEVKIKNSELDEKKWCKKIKYTQKWCKQLKNKNNKTKKLHKL